jgi:hypothetical protein
MLWWILLFVIVSIGLGGFVIFQWEMRQADRREHEVGWP